MDAELRRRDQNLEEPLKQRDGEWRAESEKKDAEWRTMIRNRENALKASLESRDRNWLNNLAHCKENFHLMTYEQVNNRTLLESLAKRQRELIESNAKILDWAIKTVSSKKKLSLPQIRISDCVPYTIVPQGVTNPPIPFSNLNPEEEIPYNLVKHQFKIKSLV